MGLLKKNKIKKNQACDISTETGERRKQEIIEENATGDWKKGDQFFFGRIFDRIYACHNLEDRKEPNKLVHLAKLPEGILKDANWLFLVF